MAISTQRLVVVAATAIVTAVPSTGLAVTIVLAGGYLGLLTETGELQIAPASPDGFEPTAKAKLFEGNSFSAFQRLTRQQQGARCWTTPVLCGHRLYVRDHTRVKCLDLRGASSTGR